LGTFIGSRDPDAVRRNPLARLHRRIVDSPATRRIQKINTIIDDMAHKMQLTTRVTEAAKCCFHKIIRKDHKKTKKDELLAVVCVAIACRQVRVTRSFKELAGFCTNVTRKELGRAFKTYTRLLKTVNTHYDLTEMVPRFTAALGFSGKDMLLCEHVVRIISSNDIVPGRNPLSCVAAAIALATELREEYAWVTSDRIAQVLGVAENTVRKALRDVLAQAALIFTPKLVKRHTISARIVQKLITARSVTVFK